MEPLQTSAVLLQVLGYMSWLTIFTLTIVLWAGPQVFIIAWFSGKMGTSKEEEEEILKFVEQSRKQGQARMKAE